VKNNRDPKNIVLRAAGKEHEKFIYNDAVFLLSMAVADGGTSPTASNEDLKLWS
jgi:hypothetical protein